jgi:hypothetical protein
MSNFFTRFNEFRAISCEFVDGSAASEKGDPRNYTNEHETMALSLINFHEGRNHYDVD